MQTDKKNIVDPNHFRVAIFGSARIQTNDPLYNQVYRLARMIAAEGMDIVTGGGPGLMEAANKGHKEGRKSDDVHSMGLNILLPNEQSANKHLDIKTDFERFSDRLDNFMTLSNIVVVAPGGIGTVLELMYTWQLQQVNHTCSSPIILLGKMWKPYIKWIEEWPLKNKLMSQSDMHPIFLADHCRETMKIIKKVYKDFKKGGPEYCLNYQKYKLEN